MKTKEFVKCTIWLLSKITGNTTVGEGGNRPCLFLLLLTKRTRIASLCLVSIARLVVVLGHLFELNVMVKDATLWESFDLIAVTTDLLCILF